MELKMEKCKGCVWGTSMGYCILTEEIKILTGEIKMACKANDFSEYSERAERT